MCIHIYIKIRGHVVKQGFNSDYGFLVTTINGANGPGCIGALYIFVYLRSTFFFVTFMPPWIILIFRGWSRLSYGWLKQFNQFISLHFIYNSYIIQTWQWNFTPKKRCFSPFKPSWNVRGFEEAGCGGHHETHLHHCDRCARAGGIVVRGDSWGFLLGTEGTALKICDPTIIYIIIQLHIYI